MTTLLYILAKVIAISLTVTSYAMIGRMVFSFFAEPDESPFYQFLILITEPFILPMRALLARFDAFTDLPIDVAFTLTYFCLILIRALLPAI